MFCLPIVALRLVLPPFFPVEDDWADFTVYFCFFVLGFLFYMDARYEKAVYRDWLVFLVAGVSCFAILLLMLATGDPFTWSESPNLPQFYLLWMLITIDGWCWAMFFLGLGMHKLDFTNATLDYCKNAILPMFILHQPVIIAIAFYVVQMDSSIDVKLPIVVLGTLAVCLGVFDLVVQRIRLFWFLFGMNPRALEKR